MRRRTVPALITVILRDQEKILLAENPEEQLVLPQDFLRPGESWEECAARIVLSQTALTLREKPLFHSVHNDRVCGAHHILIVMEGKINGRPCVMSPAEHRSWQWYDNPPERCTSRLKQIFRTPAK